MREQQQHRSSLKLQRHLSFDTDVTQNEADTIVHERQRPNVRPKARKVSRHYEDSLSSMSAVDDEVDGSDVSSISSSMFAAESSLIGEESKLDETHGSSVLEESVDQVAVVIQVEPGELDAPVVSGPRVSVVLRFDVSDVACLEISSDQVESVEFACHEPANIGGRVSFVLTVSNGWSARYDLTTGSLSSTSPAGVTINFAIPTNPNSCNSQPPENRGKTASLVRLCQRLAMRALDLRRSAFRSFGTSSDVKSPLMVHYDELPSVILDGVRARAPENMESELRDVLGRSVDTDKRSSKSRCVTIRGVGTGFINDAGELCVEFLDGARLTLASSGRQLRFLPPRLPLLREDDRDEKECEDVFELLTSGHSSAFLPTIVTRKLACVPDFIHRIKALN